jgi:sarcosine oxidase subunit beta
MQAACDILILGGGAVGVSSAYHLARRRLGRVVLLEKAFLGAGASGKSLAVLRRPDAADPAAALALLSQQFYERFPDPLIGPPVFSRTGLLLLQAELDADASSPLRRVSSQELMEIDANAHLAEGETALFDPDAGALDPAPTLAALAEAARRQGADVRQGVEVKAVTVEKGRISGVETNEGPYACGALVLTAGSWTANLARGLKATLPVQARRTQTALFRRPPDCGRRSVIVVDRAQGYCFKPAAGELIQVSGLGDEGEPVDPEQYDEAASGEWLRTVRQKLSRRFPALHRAFGRGGYAGLSAATPDGLPIVDQLPGVEGVWCAAGFGDRDVALAPAAGAALAALLAGAAADGGPDLGPFRLGRFAEQEATAT